MGLLNSMYSAVTGMQVTSQGMSIISDNIANVNTVGFKKSRGNFQDLISMSILGIGNISQIGMGAGLTDVQQLFEQGSLENSSQGTDMAISGGGFFIVNGSVNGVAGNFYTRAGQFTFNNEGYLVNASGLRVQGYNVDDNAVVSGALGDIKITDTQIQPRPTAEIELNANLDANADIIPAFDGSSFDNAADTSNFHTTIKTYDSLGNSHETTLYFTKTADNTWQWNALADGEEVSGGAAGDPPVNIGTGTVTFNNDGTLATLVPDPPVLGPVTYTGANPMTITMDLGTAGIPGVTDPSLVGLTQYASESTALFSNQDGYPTGNLRYINVDENGLITGSYSNGEILNLGKMALANFQSNTGLQKLGGNLWSETTKSGEPLIGEANTGTRGTVIGNALENSNVDMAEELVDMIVTQRAFQANSKAVTTTDTMLGTIMNIKQ